MAPKYANEQPAGFTNRIERVAIVGAGGQVGKYIAEHLLKTGKHTVTAVSRVGSESRLPAGIKVVAVDYSDESTIVEALRGQQFLIISMSITAPPEAHKKLVDAAAKAGVPWVMPNGYTSDITNETLSKENLNGQQATGRAHDVEAAGVSSWIMLCCSFWYEYSLSMGPAGYGFDIPNKKVTFYDDGKTRINTSTWDQCGRAMAALLSLKELPNDENDTSPTVSTWRNKPLFVSSFLASQREMLDSIHRVMGTTDKDWGIEYEPSDARYKRGLGLLGSGSPQVGFPIALYARTFYPNGDGNFEAKHDLANGALGLPKEDFDQSTKMAVGMVESGYKAFNRK